MRWLARRSELDVDGDRQRAVHVRRGCRAQRNGARSLAASSPGVCRFLLALWGRRAGQRAGSMSPAWTRPGPNTIVDESWAMLLGISYIAAQNGLAAVRSEVM